MRKTREEIHQLVQHERKLKNRLQLATTRLEEAERERIWAIVAAHDAGRLDLHAPGLDTGELALAERDTDDERDADAVRPLRDAVSAKITETLLTR